MSRRSKNVKQEYELRIIANPMINPQFSTISQDDYEAPLTSFHLLPHSKWFIVRNNLHKIRTWGGMQSNETSPHIRDWYLFFQTRRELRRVQDHVKNIQNRPNFRPVQYFYLPTDETHRRRFTVSHVKSTDALFYSGFGKEPVAIQSLLYYFSKECAVPYNSVFRPFLSDVCSIVYHDRQQITRVAVFRRVAFAVTIIIFLILALMFVSLILSVLKTTSDFYELYDTDPHGGLDWIESE